MNPRIDGAGRTLPIAFTALFAVGFALLGVLAPVRTDCPATQNRSTHLVCAIQAAEPVTALLLVALPLLVFAVIIATNQAILFSGAQAPLWARPLSRGASLAAGPIMVGLAAFATARIIAPHARSGEWLGAADMISSAAFVTLVVPAVVVTLVELQLLGADRRRARQLNGVAAIAGLLLIIVVVTAGSMSTDGIVHVPALLGTPSP
jgi:hypothetical protein